MNFKRTLIALAAGAAVSTAGFASASVLPVSGGALQHGTTSMTCDQDGVTLSNWALETDTNTVNRVKVNHIAATCAGAKVFVKFDDRAQMSQVVPAGGGTLDFNFAPINADLINGAQVWIQG